MASLSLKFNKVKQNTREYLDMPHDHEPSYEAFSKQDNSLEMVRRPLKLKDHDMLIQQYYEKTRQSKHSGGGNDRHYRYHHQHQELLHQQNLNTSMGSILHGSRRNLHKKEDHTSKQLFDNMDMGRNASLSGANNTNPTTISTGMDKATATSLTKETCYKKNSNLSSTTNIDHSLLLDNTNASNSLDTDYLFDNFERCYEIHFSPKANINKEKKKNKYNIHGDDDSPKVRKVLYDIFIKDITEENDNEDYLLKQNMNISPSSLSRSMARISPRSLSLISPGSGLCLSTKQLRNYLVGNEDTRQNILKMKSNKNSNGKIPFKRNYSTGRGGIDLKPSEIIIESKNTNSPMRSTFAKNPKFSKDAIIKGYKNYLNQYDDNPYHDAKPYYDNNNSNDMSIKLPDILNKNNSLNRDIGIYSNKEYIYGEYGNRDYVDRGYDNREHIRNKPINRKEDSNFGYKIGVMDSSVESINTKYMAQKRQQEQEQECQKYHHHNTQQYWMPNHLTMANNGVNDLLDSMILLLNKESNKNVRKRFIKKIAELNEVKALKNNKDKMNDESSLNYMQKIRNEFIQDFIKLGILPNEQHCQQQQKYQQQYKQDHHQQVYHIMNECEEIKGINSSKIRRKGKENDNPNVYYNMMRLGNNPGHSSSHNLHHNLNQNSSHNYSYQNIKASLRHEKPPIRKRDQNTDYDFALQANSRDDEDDGNRPFHNHSHASIKTMNHTSMLNIKAYSGSNNNPFTKTTCNPTIASASIANNEDIDKIKASLNKLKKITKIIACDADGNNDSRYENKHSNEQKYVLKRNQRKDDTQNVDLNQNSMSLRSISVPRC